MALTLGLGLASALPALSNDAASPSPSPSAAPSPVATSSAKVVQRFELLTSLKPTDRMGVVAGTLALRVMDDGTLRGSYSSEGGSPRAVSGTLKGKNLSMEIGLAGDFHVEGTMDADGSIDATTLRGSHAYTFKAVPKT